MDTSDTHILSASCEKSKIFTCKEGDALGESVPTIGQLLQLHGDAGLVYAVAEVHRKFKDDPKLNQGPLALLRYNFAQRVVFDNHTSERYRTGYLNDNAGETPTEDRKRAYHNYNRTKNLKGKKLDESILKKAKNYYRESDVFVAEACQEGSKKM